MSSDGFWHESSLREQNLRQKTGCIITMIFYIGMAFDGQCEMVATMLSYLRIRPDMWSGRPCI